MEEGKSDYLCFPHAFLSTFVQDDSSARYHHNLHQHVAQQCLLRHLHKIMGQLCRNIGDRAKSVRGYHGVRWRKPIS